MQGRKGRGEGTFMGPDPDKTPAVLVLRAWHFLIFDIFILACPEFWGFIPRNWATWARLAHTAFNHTSPS